MLCDDLDAIATNSATINERTRLSSLHRLTRSQHLYLSMRKRGAFENSAGVRCKLIWTCAPSKSRQFYLLLMHCNLCVHASWNFPHRFSLTVSTIYFVSLNCALSSYCPVRSILANPLEMAWTSEISIKNDFPCISVETHAPSSRSRFHRAMTCRRCLQVK